MTPPLHFILLYFPYFGRILNIFGVGGRRGGEEGRGRGGGEGGGGVKKKKEEERIRRIGG